LKRPSTKHDKYVVDKKNDYLHGIYPNEFEAKYTTASQKSASFLDLYLEIDNGGRLKTKVYDKRKYLISPRKTKTQHNMC
jgi:hypothetical protein